MLGAIFHRIVARFERSFGYDGGYLHEMVDASARSAFKFMLFQPLANHRENVPREAWFAAKLAGAMSEDCGPCSQLVVDMALEAGVSAATLIALARDQMTQAGADAALGFRYGRAVAVNQADAASLAREVRERFGDRGLVSLAFAVASARVFPTLKRGMGHGAACRKLVIEEEVVPVGHIG